MAEQTAVPSSTFSRHAAAALAIVAACAAALIGAASAGATAISKPVGASYTLNPGSGNPGSQATGITKASDGAMWVTDLNGRVWRVASNGAASSYPANVGPPYTPQANHPTDAVNGIAEYPYSITGGGSSSNMVFAVGPENVLNGISFVSDGPPSLGYHAGEPAECGASYYNGIAVVGENIWAANEGGFISKLDLHTGTCLNYYPPAGSGVTNIHDIALGPDGSTLFFTDYVEQKLGSITQAGVITVFPTTTNGPPNYIAKGPNGKLFFTEQNGPGNSTRIGTLDPSGAIHETAGPSGRKIVLGPDGNMWFTTFYGVAAFDPTSIDSTGSITGPIRSFDVGNGANEGLAVGTGNTLWLTSFTYGAGQNSSVTKFPVGVGPAPQLDSFGYANSRTPTLTGVADPHSNVTIKIYAGTAATGTPAQTLIATPGTDGRFSVMTGALNEGQQYTAQATQTDASGTGTSDPVTFTVDTTPPTVTLTSPANGSTVHNQVTFAGQAEAASANNPVTITLTDSSSNPAGTLTVYPDSTTGAYSLQDNNPPPDGTYTAQASQQDYAGNTGYSPTITFTVQAQPPGRCNGGQTSVWGLDSIAIAHNSAWFPGFGANGTASPPACPGFPAYMLAFGSPAPYSSSASDESTQALNTWGAGGSGQINTNGQLLATDRAPTSTEISNMVMAGSKGNGIYTPPNTGGNAARPAAAQPALATAGQLVHSIPAAQTSLAIFVNLPAGCAVPPQEHVTNQTLSQVFAGNVANWKALFPDANGSACSTTAVTRAVLKHSEQSTAVLKKYLAQVDSATWSAHAGPGTDWPNDPSAQSPLDKTSANGAVEASHVASTAGTIGYAYLPDAEQGGIHRHSQDGPFWLKIQNNGTSATPTYADPQSSDALNQANCFNTAYSNVPSGGDPTTGDWSGVSGAAPTQGTASNYSLCTLLYEIAWDSYTKAFGGSTKEASIYQTTQDLLRYITDPNVTGGGAFAIKGNGYGHVPEPLLTIANRGAYLVRYR